MNPGVWQYVGRPSWRTRIKNAVLDIPYLITDVVAADEGWRSRAFFALILIGFCVAGLIWLVGWALRGFAVA